MYGLARVSDDELVDLKARNVSRFNAAKLRQELREMEGSPVMDAVRAKMDPVAYLGQNHFFGRRDPGPYFQGVAQEGTPLAEALREWGLPGKDDEVPAEGVAAVVSAEALGAKLAPLRAHRAQCPPPHPGSVGTPAEILDGWIGTAEVAIAANHSVFVRCSRRFSGSGFMLEGASFDYEEFRSRLAAGDVGYFLDLTREEFARGQVWLMDALAKEGDLCPVSLFEYFGPMARRAIQGDTPFDGAFIILLEAAELNCNLFRGDPVDHSFYFLDEGEVSRLFEACAAAERGELSPAHVQELAVRLNLADEYDYTADGDLYPALTRQVAPSMSRFIRKKAKEQFRLAVATCSART